MSSRPSVVVIGAGFGGLAAARHLENEAVDVTVVDQRNFHTFQPLLYQVATSGLNAADVAYVVRGMFQRSRNVDFRRALVTGVDWEGRKVMVDDGEPLLFDHLVVAVGATANYFGTPGAEEYGHVLYTLEDATRLRNHIIERFEEAARHPERIANGLLNFVVVGGGPTGVEMAGALAELIESVLQKDYHSYDASQARIILVEAGDKLLAPFAPKLQRYTLKVLEKSGVEIRFGALVESIEPDLVHLKGGDVIASHTLIWAAGVKANPLAELLAVEQSRGGRIVVEVDLSIKGQTDAYAIGDVSDVDDGSGGRLPQLAQPAIQGGHHVAEQILHRVAGRQTEPFSYFDKGTMATIGRRAAVAELAQGPKLTGIPAWGAWLALHLLYLMGMRNRVSVLINWSWNYLTWDRGPRLIFGSGVRRNAIGSTGDPASSTVSNRPPQ